MTNKKFSENELSVMTDDLHWDITILSNRLWKVSSVASAFLIANLLLVASIGIILLSKVTQGSYSHFPTFASTVVFIFLNGLSIILLLSAISTVNKVQYHETLNIAETDSQNVLKAYYTKRITKLNQVKEDKYEKLQKTVNLTHASISITGAAITIYAIVLSFTYFF